MLANCGHSAVLTLELLDSSRSATHFRDLFFFGSFASGITDFV